MDKYLESLIETALKRKKTKEPEKEEEVDEIVDADGTILGSKIPADVNVKTITSKSTTDQVVKQSRQPPDTGLNGSPMRRYWGETDMSSQLGYEETLGKDLDYSRAKKYFMDDLGFDEKEAEERLEKLGYTKKSDATDKVRLIEEPSKHIEEIIDDVLSKRTTNRSDIARKYNEEREIDPILRRQLVSLKDTLEANNLTINDVIQYLR